MAKEIPVFVTRPTANGEIGAWWLNAYISVGLFLLVTANIIGWSIYGLVTLVRMVLS